jgi:ornithine cyclodeaminase/alanine dehydrogenase-like protein (mu-crystallin family)
MTLLLSDEDVRATLEPASLIDALEEFYRAEAGGSSLVPARANLAHETAFLRVMPALLPDSDVMGLKVFHRGTQSGVSYLVIVYDVAAGETLGLVDAAYLTAARTGATSALAARQLAPDAQTAAVLGSGLEAETNLLAAASCLPLRHVKVYSPRQARREDFAARMSGVLGLSVEPSADPEDAVGGTDLVIVATNTGRAGGAAYRGEWAEPGQCVVSIGSTNPRLRELNTRMFTRADRIVVDAPAGQVAEESGDVIALLKDPAGRDRWQANVAQLATIVKIGIEAPRHGEIRLFKSVGSAGQDLIAARLAIQAAIAARRGRQVGALTTPKFFLS